MIPASIHSNSCACHGELPRRGFIGLGLASLASIGAWLGPWRAVAGPFTREDFNKLVPADKGLAADWVKALYERGTRGVLRGTQLDKVGMPIGGICAGQLYLGGDGRLWHWDIFNRRIATGAEHYSRPMQPASPVDQGFVLRVHSQGVTKDRTLDRAGWEDVSFAGEYPIGRVEYRDRESPVAVSLEAFSPFIPLNAEDSSLPATVLRFTVKNHGATAVGVQLAGWLENAACLYSSNGRDGVRRNRVTRAKEYLMLECGAEEAPAGPSSNRPDIVFDDFENEAYASWKVEGTAFGAGPVPMAAMPGYQGNVGGHGKRVVNSHASAPGADVGTKDDAHGRLTSRAFVIERDYITLLVGGGAHEKRTCVNLMVEDTVVQTVTGANDNRMKPVTWDVRRWAGKTARLQVLDDQSGGWGNIGVDHIVFSDQPRTAVGPLAEEGDFGTLGLALLEPLPGDSASAALPEARSAEGVFSANPPAGETVASRPFGQKLAGSLMRRLELAPGQSAGVTFVLTWHMPNLRLDRLPPGRHYGVRFRSAADVARHVAANFARLSNETRLWHDTWYDSSLPFWFLDRTFLNTSILASSTCYRLANGRFYAWEGVGCCEGTCGHVWQYAHAVARLFPELERVTREQVDFGLAQQPDGAIFFRGEFNNIPAIDAQAGTVLRALREHQMSPDDAFLKRNWARIRLATQWLIGKDANYDGVIEGNQHNTLDTDWFGPVAWLSGLYLAALAAAERMAHEVGDQDFARTCRSILEPGRRNLVRELFEDGYFKNRPDQQRLDAINSGTGCHIDQVMGQGWAFQVGLGRVLPEAETLSALKSLWRYNFTPDVGPYRGTYKAGRWYAMPGEAGLLMCTFPRTDWDYAQAKGKGPEWAAGYFNECMNGFEYQVAGHMLWEGMVIEGLAITRAVHERYDASRRNPWNEVECGDHYARSMASYGVFLAACGYEHDGPGGYLAFAPRLKPEAFRAPFTTAEGWGTFGQGLADGKLTASISLKWGRLRLRTLGLSTAGRFTPGAVKGTLAGQPLAVTLKHQASRVTLEFAGWITLSAGETLDIGVTS